MKTNPWTLGSGVEWTSPVHPTAVSAGERRAATGRRNDGLRSARRRSGARRLSARLVVAQAVFLGFALLIVGQLVRWQLVARTKLAPKGERLPGAAAHATAEVPPRRGLILDRNYGLLALNGYEYNVSAAPNQIPEEETAQVAERLALILGGSAGDLVNELYEKLSGDGLYVQIERQVSRQVGQALLDLQAEGELPGIHLRPVAVRVYPEHALAAHVLGFVAGDAQEGTKGYYGIEGFYDKILKGRSGLRSDLWSATQIGGPWHPVLAFDPQQAASMATGRGRGWRVPEDGRTLVLTLDKTLQYLIEQELRDAVERYGAEGGSVVVLDPKTGALLALASYPPYDPNQFAAIEEKRLIDPSIGRHYEPGSTFKVITMAAALDAGAVSVDDVYNDLGYIEVGGRILKNWDEKAYGVVTMSDIMAHSLNTGIAHVSTLLGADRFYHYVERFGFGRPLGVDLEGEVSGSVRRQGDPEWHESDLGTNSFGQGLAATPLQMAVAVGAIANRGFMMQPYVVSQMLEDAPAAIVGRREDVATRLAREDLAGVEVKQVALRQVITEDTARLVTEMMVEAVERGAPLARVEGYRIAGKTGTAQTPVIGGYDPSLTIASFVGFAPADDPQFVALVKLDKPTTFPWGAMTAAPTFANIARILFTHLAIPPSINGSAAGG